MTKFYVARNKGDILAELSIYSNSFIDVNISNVHILVICMDSEESEILGIWIDSEEVLPKQDEYKSIVFELKLLGFL